MEQHGNAGSQDTLAKQSLFHVRDWTDHNFLPAWDQKLSRSRNIDPKRLIPPFEGAEYKCPNLMDTSGDVTVVGSSDN
jgi:hypothetical protein